MLEISSFCSYEISQVTQMSIVIQIGVQILQRHASTNSSSRETIHSNGITAWYELQCCLDTRVHLALLQRTRTRSFVPPRIQLRQLLNALLRN